ncbi:MAG TPA: class I SAM-dependent methyltransferase, partial [Ktedonobacterales bacterium]
MRAPAPRADYGLDAPGFVRGCLLIGAVALAAGLVVATVASAGGNTTDGLAVLSFAVARAAVWLGAVSVISGLAMLWSSRYGKPRARDRLLDTLGLGGDETVLDIGCGRGLLLIGAAKRLPRGKAIGVDVWSGRDQSANTPEATLTNARVEGVADRVSVLTGDMRALPLVDASVDCVVSSLAIHNLHGRDDRRRAIKELVRVLRPGGRIALLDIANTAE